MKLLSSVATIACLTTGSAASAVDLESFLFNDPNGTPLPSAMNVANPGNQWFYDEQATTPGDDMTGDVSTIQSGAYEIKTQSNFATGLEARYLDIANVSAGKVYLTATIESWDFGSLDTNTEQFRFGFLDDDTGDSGSTVTAQMQIRRDTDTGMMQLVGDAIGTAGSFDIANTVELPTSKSNPFIMVLAVDKDANSYEVFYKDGVAPSQVLGLGGVSRVRDANSVRMVTGGFNSGDLDLPPFILSDQVRLDSVVVSDANPLTDLVTLEIDRDTGAISLVNNSGAAITGVNSVTFDSATGSIDASQLVAFSGTLNDGQTVVLDTMPGSAPGAWLQSPVEDIRAQLNLGSGVRTLNVDFVGNGGAKFPIGDLNFNGVIDAADYAILAANAETDLSGETITGAYQLGDLTGDLMNDVADFALFKTEYIDANGAPAFARLVAGVPEPATATLLIGAGLAACSWRRRRRTTTIEPNLKRLPMNQSATLLTVVLALACIGLQAPKAQAVIFEEFLFDDTAGLEIEQVTNSANPGNMFTADAQGDSAGVVTNGLGQLDLSAKNNDNFGTHFVDIEPAITTGVVYGVMELTWDFQSPLNTAENEQLRISLTNNDPTGTQITAEFRLERDDSDEMIITGRAVGTGATNLPDVPIVGGSKTQTDKFIAVVAADLDNDSYEVLYSTNAGTSFLSAGSANIDPTRVVEAFRMAINNDFVDDNVLIDRVYIADELPIVPDVETLTLQVNTTTGSVSIVNGTDNDFDIDYYRISSGDDSLLEANWNSLQEQGLDAVDGPDVGSTAGDGIGERWTQAGGSDEGVLSESFLLSSSVIASMGSPINLGAIFDLSGDTEQLNLEFRDAATGAIFAGKVELVVGLDGDFNGDNIVNAADYTTWRNGLGTTYTAADYLVWRNNYGMSLGAGGGAGVATPEPAAGLLALVAGLIATIVRRRNAG